MEPSADASSPTPAPSVTKADAGALCPYCGAVSASAKECDRCRGLFEPLSRQASQNAMGPWFIRDEQSPFRPGCSYDTMRALVARGRVGPETILRGPSTRQFWMRGRNVPGVAHLMGECHSCHKAASPTSTKCASCGAGFAVEEDRQYLGLAEVRAVPRPGATPERREREPAPVEVVATVSEESGPVAFEPVRHPGRPAREVTTLDDARIDAMLQQGRKSKRASRGSGTVIALLLMAFLATAAAVAYAATLVVQSMGRQNAAAAGASSPVPVAPSPPPATPAASKGR